jgi:hypothetical protein
MEDRIIKAWIIFIFITFIGTGVSFADGIDSVGFFAGYMEGDIDGPDDYRAIPLMVNFGFDLKPLLEKIGLRSEGIVEFQVEPFLSPIIEPEANIETGVNLLFKYAFPLAESFMPYIKIGSGPSFMSLHTREQSTQFNFVSSGCAGFSLFVKDNMSLDFEYRFRHLSNCSIDHPNSGINTHAILAGCTFRFE